MLLDVTAKYVNGKGMFEMDIFRNLFQGWQILTYSIVFIMLDMDIQFLNKNVFFFVVLFLHGQIC